MTTSVGLSAASLKTADSTSREPVSLRHSQTIIEPQQPYNRVLGREAIDITPELVGSMAHQRPHGGVGGAAPESMPGLTIMAGIAVHHMDEPPVRRLDTIVLRVVDYLRQSIGTESCLAARVMCRGSRRRHPDGVPRRRRHIDPGRRCGGHRVLTAVTATSISLPGSPI